ncbi:hypothetical protein B0H19DRAFT_1131896 [Mycena capillaripes]|nr:hypothetical protein B0H19DRAFT_1131896 [Mycena capillaripes]
MNIFDDIESFLLSTAYFAVICLIVVYFSTPSPTKPSSPSPPASPTLSRPASPPALETATSSDPSTPTPTQPPTSEKKNDPVKKLGREMKAVQKDLRDLKEALRVSYISLVGPLYGSILIKGVASSAFWHGEGLYAPDVVLSVGQLTFLNEELEKIKPGRAHILSAAKKICKDHPLAGVLKATFRTSELDVRHPGILSCPTIIGNPPAHEPLTANNLATMQNKWRVMVDRRDRAAHEASAQQIADYLRIINKFKDQEGEKE